MKTTKTIEKVWVMRVQSGWGEQYKTEMDELTEITAEAIHHIAKNRITDFKCQDPPSIEEIQEWLDENRKGVETNELFLFRQAECPTCGNDDDTKFDLYYETEEYNEIEVDFNDEKSINELAKMLNETTNELNQRNK